MGPCLADARADALLPAPGCVPADPPTRPLPLTDVSSRPEALTAQPAAQALIALAPDSGAPSSDDSASDESEDSDAPEDLQPGQLLPEDEINPADDPLVDPVPNSMAAWERQVFDVVPRVFTPEPPEKQASKVREVLAGLEDAPVEPTLPEVQRLRTNLEGIPSEIPDAEDFVAGSFSHNRYAWEEMLKGDGSRAARRVRGWLREGFKPVFGDPQKAKPQKRRIVEAMLNRQYPGQDPATFLTGNRPHRVAFRNHRSFYEHWEFSSKELLKLLLWGAIALVKPGEEPVEVESPLGVVDQEGKCRLFLNGRYVNIFLAELPFRYQRLRDVLLFVLKDSFMSTWDLKSGYYHIPLHPSFRKYMGFRVGRLVFRYNVPAFGLSQACFLFTRLMNEPAKALRRRGVPISDYIDDGITAAATFGRCLQNALFSVRLLGALGAYLGLPKCHLTPEQLRQWLGFIIDSVQQRFQLSPSRVAKLKRQLQNLFDAPAITARDLASVAGRIVSASPAVLPASLLSRPFFQALTGKLSWDDLFPNQQAVKETAQFWMQNLDRFNGRPWWPRPVALEATADASGLGYGGELTVFGFPPVVFRGTFSPQFASASSTAREVAGYVAATEAAIQISDGRLDGASLLLTGDNQAAVACVNNLRSSRPEIHQLLRRLFDLCLDANCGVQARWRPRELITRADELSKEPDASDWGLSPQLVSDICAKFGVSPVIDLFASAVHHVSDKFISKYFEPGCTGVQAMALDWRLLCQPSETAWVFPPPNLVNQALARLSYLRIDAVFVLRYQEASNEWVTLRSIQQALVSAPFMIPRSGRSCHPSLRVPAKAINPAFTGLCAIHIKWCTI